MEGDTSVDQVELHIPTLYHKRAFAIKCLQMLSDAAFPHLKKVVIVVESSSGWAEWEQYFQRRLADALQATAIQRVDSLVLEYLTPLMTDQRDCILQALGKARFQFRRLEIRNRHLSCPHALKELAQVIAQNPGLRTLRVDTIRYSSRIGIDEFCLALSESSIRELHWGSIMVNQNHWAVAEDCQLRIYRAVRQMRCLTHWRIDTPLSARLVESLLEIQLPALMSKESSIQSLGINLCSIPLFERLDYLRQLNVALLHGGKERENKQKSIYDIDHIELDGIAGWSFDQADHAIIEELYVLLPTLKRCRRLTMNLFNPHETGQRQRSEKQFLYRILHECQEVEELVLRTDSFHLTSQDLKELCEVFKHERSKLQGLHLLDYYWADRGFLEPGNSFPNAEEQKVLLALAKACPKLTSFQVNHQCDLFPALQDQISLNRLESIIYPKILRDTVSLKLLPQIFANQRSHHDLWFRLLVEKNADIGQNIVLEDNSCEAESLSYIPLLIILSLSLFLGLLLRTGSLEGL